MLLVLDVIIRAVAVECLVPVAIFKTQNPNKDEAQETICRS